MKEGGEEEKSVQHWNPGTLGSEEVFKEVTYKTVLFS